MYIIESAYEDFMFVCVSLGNNCKKNFYVESTITSRASSTWEDIPAKFSVCAVSRGDSVWASLSFSLLETRLSADAFLAAEDTAVEPAGLTVSLALDFLTVAWPPLDPGPRNRDDSLKGLNESHATRISI